MNGNLNLQKGNFVFACMLLMFGVNVLWFMGGTYAIGQYSIYHTFVESGSSLYPRLLSLSYIASIAVCFLLSIRKGRVYLFNKTYGVLLFTVLAWTAYTIVMDSGVIAYFLTATSPVIFLCILTAPAGYEERTWKYLEKKSILLATLFILASLSFFLSASFQYGLSTGGTPHIYMLSYGFWFLALSILANKENVKLKHLLVMTCAIISIAYGSRSWTILCLLLEAILISTHRKSTDAGWRLKLMLGGIVAAGVVYLILSVYFTSALEVFEGRLMHATRGKQYATFFEQIDLKTWMLGGGMNAVYTYKGNAEYKYFDNAFVFITMHYGIIVAGSYYLFLTLPVFKYFKLRRNLRKRGSAMPHKGNVVLVLVFWLLAISGVSVYNGLSYDIKSIWIMLVAGRSYAVLKEIKQEYLNGI